MEAIELIRLLSDRGVTPIVIGGVAMRLYDSPRVTQDLDLAVRTLDTERILETMYELSYALVVGVDDKSARFAPTRSVARAWVDRENPGSLSFVIAPIDMAGDTMIVVEHRIISIESQVDFLYELPVPYPRLKLHARSMEVAGHPMLVAAPVDLIALKQDRSDRSSTDDFDIAFLQGLGQDEDD